MKRFCTPVALLAILALLQGCNLASDGPTAPSNSPDPPSSLPAAARECAASQIELSSEMTTAAAHGARGTVAIEAAGGCSWTAVSAVEWISLTSNATGSGAGQVEFLVSANPAAERRIGAIGVNGRELEITQDGLSCRLRLDRVVQKTGDEAGSFSVGVIADAACNWTAASNDAWITLSSAATGSGNGTVRFRVAANTGPAREGTLTLAGLTFTVVQASGCTYDIAPASLAVAAGGGPGSTAVTAGGGCGWTAASNDTWITLTSGGSGSGNGTVAFTVAANAGAARAGTVRIAGQSFTVNQAAAGNQSGPGSQPGGCSYSISPTTQSPGAAGGAGSATVTAGSGCAWTAASNDGWIALTSSASGSGNGTVTFSVAANTGAARTGTLTIAGQTFTVTQAGGCTYSISPTTQSPGTAGGAGSTAVTAGSGCTWTAASNDGWITLTSSANGSGNDTATFTVAANSGPARTGTLTIAGQTFTVTQTGGCTYSISPTTQSPGAAGGAGSTTVTAGSGCTWTAASNDGWITLTSSANGTGNDTATFTVAANSGPPRTGTLTIAGQTFTVTQAGGCTYSISPTTQSPGAAGGAGSTAVTAGSSCTWTAASNDAWIMLTSSASGIGNDTATFSVAANTGAARAGTLTIAGQTFTVTQASGCTYSISPNTQSPGAAGGAGSTAVTAGSGCTWTAASNDAWITLTSSANGTGSATTTFTVAANTSPARTGTLTIAGQTFTVTQANGCTYAISPASQSLGVAGGTGSVNVTAGTGCSWTATSNAGWIAVTGGSSGSGDGSVTYLVTLNGTLAPRSGTLTIGGQTFTVNQSN